MVDCMAAVPGPPLQAVEHTVEAAVDKQERQVVEDSRRAWARPDSRGLADTAVAEDSRRAWAPERARIAVVADTV